MRGNYTGTVDARVTCLVAEEAAAHSGETRLQTTPVATLLSWRLLRNMGLTLGWSIVRLNWDLALLWKVFQVWRYFMNVLVAVGSPAAHNPRLPAR